TPAPTVQKPPHTTPARRPDIDPCGLQTARHYGVEIVKNLMVDAETTSRWYFVIAMGRKAGHLALGIGKAAGATLTLIPEEFGATVRLKKIVDTLVGAILKRLSRSEEHTSELQSLTNLVCRLLLEKKNRLS